MNPRKPRLVTGGGPLHDAGLPYNLVGSDQEERSLKSRYEDSNQAVQLALLRTYIRVLYADLMALRARQGLEWLTLRQAMEVYRGFRSYQELHRQLTGHLVSVEGFAIKASVEAFKLGQAEASQEKVVVQQAVEHGTNGNGQAPRYG